MKKPSILRRIFSFLLRLLTVVLLMAVIAFGSFEGVTYYFTGSFFDFKEEVEKQKGTTTDSTQTQTQANLNDENVEATLLFVDSDDGSSEYTVLNLYNTDTKMLDLILFPEDADVEISASLLKKVQKTIPDAKSEVTFSEIVRAYGDDRYEMLAGVIADLTTLDIRGYDILTKENLADLIDTADAVSYTLDNEISYRDSNEMLHSIEGGEQKLSGTKAVALMSYLDGTDEQESERLERTSAYLQDFLTALCNGKKKDDFITAYTSLAESERQDGVTSVSDILEGLDADSFMMRIVQGSEKDGIYTLDDQKVQLQLSALIKQTDTASAGSTQSSSGTTQTSSSSDSKDKSIELYNAAYVSGLAAEWQEYLESEGYDISLIDSYQEEGPISQTRIRVTQEGEGEDLLTYFPDAEITVVDSIPTGGDIRIYIGTDYTEVPEISSSGTTSDEWGESVESDEDDTDSTEEEDYDSSDEGSGYDFDSQQ